MERSSGEWEELPNVPARVGQINAMVFFREIDGLAYFHSCYDRGSVTNYLKYPRDVDAWERTGFDAPFGTQSAYSEENAPRSVVYSVEATDWSNGAMEA